DGQMTEVQTCALPIFEIKRSGPSSGDNSNTQYAALGMRACHDAGIIIPAAVTEKATAWYRQCQKAAEGAAEKLDIKDSLDKISEIGRALCRAREKRCR